MALRGPKEIKLSHDQQRVQVWLDFFFRGMAQVLKSGKMQVFQGPKVNRSYNITTNGTGCLVLGKLFVTSIFEKQNQS